MKIHAGKATEAITQERREKLQKAYNRDIKAVCLLRGITKEELWAQQYDVLRKLVLS
jgi:hypothetical protein